MSDDDLEPAAYILQMPKRDGTLQKTAMLREHAEGKIVEQPLFSAEQFLDILRDVQQERCDCGLDIDLYDTCQSIEAVRERVESAEKSGEDGGE